MSSLKWKDIKQGMTIYFVSVYDRDTLEVTQAFVLKRGFVKGTGSFHIWTKKLNPRHGMNEKHGSSTPAKNYKEHSGQFYRSPREAVAAQKHFIHEAKRRFPQVRKAGEGTNPNVGLAYKHKILDQEKKVVDIAD